MVPVEGGGMRLIEITSEREQPPSRVIRPTTQESSYETHFRGTIRTEVPIHSECVIMQTDIDVGELYHRCT